MVSDTAITDGKAAHRAKNRVRLTPSAAAALSASEGDSATFNGALSSPIHLGHNGEVASKLGWHEAGL